MQAFDLSFDLKFKLNMTIVHESFMMLNLNLDHRERTATDSLSHSFRQHIYTPPWILSECTKHT